LLDGYPRNAAQVDHLDAFLGRAGAELDAVIVLDVPRDVSIARITERARIENRSDDTEEAIAQRLEIYDRETAPIVDTYATRGIVDRIDGVGSVDEITERIFAALDARGLARS